MSSMSSDDTPTIETSPKRPYLVRAFYDWIVDNGLTPHVLVNASMENVQVPQNYVKDDSIVLNLSPGAVHDWYMDNDAISFSARFNGSAFPIYLPMQAVMAIYARENQDGLSFHDAEYVQEGEDSPGASSSDDKTESAKPAISAVETDTTSAGSAEQDAASAETDTPPPKTRPALRVVK